MNTDETTHLEKNIEFWNSPESIELYGKQPRLDIGEMTILQSALCKHTQKPYVLDIGCGAGRTTYFVDKLGGQVIGIDIAETLLEIGRAKFPHIEFRYGNALALEFEAEEFDVVLFMANGLDCLYPFESRITSLREVYRVLKPGGLFVSSHHSLPALVFGWHRMMQPWKLVNLRAKNILNGNVFKRECYISTPDDSGGLQLYYAWPKTFINTVTAVGFELLEIAPNSRLLNLIQKSTGITAFSRMADPWPNYLFRKVAMPGMEVTEDEKRS